MAPAPEGLTREGGNGGGGILCALSPFTRCRCVLIGCKPVLSDLVFKRGGGCGWSLPAAVLLSDSWPVAGADLGGPSAKVGRRGGVSPARRRVGRDRPGPYSWRGGTHQEEWPWARHRGTLHPMWALAGADLRSSPVRPSAEWAAAQTQHPGSPGPALKQGRKPRLSQGLRVSEQELH